MMTEIAEVLSIVVDGKLVNAVYILRDGTVVAYWPRNVLTKEIKEVATYIPSKGKPGTVILLYSKGFDYIYMGVSIKNTYLVMRFRKVLLYIKNALPTLITYLSIFSIRVNELINKAVIKNV
ncbi:MAG: hypothetical protein B6U85_09380 [Desulfurococcales archaeon ex4484_42]|nr:MAG: hypothetical protein B6U85_09380 [Desulfurococcales archaeon ex4484_42]